MGGVVKNYIWTDSMFCEEENGWFIGGNCSVLFHLNFRTGKLSFISELVSSKIMVYNFYSFCIKIRQYIYCFPGDRNNNIVIYNLISKEQEIIPVENPYGKKVNSIFGGKWKDKIYIILSGLGKIMEIDTNNISNIRYHHIADDEFLRTESVIIGNSIVFPSKLSTRLYEFNMDTYEVTIHNIVEINSIHTICYDGSNCWITGCERKIFAYNWEKKQISVVKEFPEELMYYNVDGNNQIFCSKEIMDKEFGFFGKSVNTLDKIWFIPFRSNKIVYVDKNDMRLNIFEIPNEDENNKLRRCIKQKYAVEYVLKDNIIGIYSFKNKCVYEINSKFLTMKKKEYNMEAEDINLLDLKIMEKDGYISEGHLMELEDYICEVISQN